MRRLAASTAITLALTALMLYGGVFRLAVKAICAAFGARYDSASIQTIVADREISDVSNGEDPYRGLQTVSTRWSAAKPCGKVILIGNSQTFAAVLAPGESAPATPFAPYGDTIARRLACRKRAAFYRLSAPNLSYLEALWYVTYLTAIPALRPNRIVLQLNFESFRKTGIRDGMLGLLREPAFAAAVRSTADGACYHAVAFRQALERYSEQQHAERNRTSRSTSHAGFGVALQSEVARVLVSRGVQARKHEAKSDVLMALYLLRVYLLGITPTTPRPLSGAAYESSRHALDAIATLCHVNGVELGLFFAPHNPATRLWRTDADRERYRTAAYELARRYRLTLVDLENDIPADYWGAWVDGPDPIHFGLRGHARMAELMMNTALFR